MIEDDRPSHPMTFWVEVILEGRIDRETFEEALDEGLAQHPLLTASLSGRGRRKVWVTGPHRAPALDWSDEHGAPLAAPERFPLWTDPTRGSPVQIWVRQGGSSAKIFFLFKHACVDAIAAIRFIGDIFAAYGCRRAGPQESPRMKALDPGQLSRRGRFEVTPPGPIWGTPPLKRLIQELFKLTVRRPQELIFPARTGVDLDWNGLPPQEHTLFEAEDVDRLRRAARRHEAGLNDLLLAGMYATIRGWNSRLGVDDPGSWLRVTIPVSMRGSADDRMPACNRLGFTFLTRRSSECDDVLSLLDGIRQDTDAIRKWMLGRLFVNGVRLVDSLPWALTASTRARRCFSTAVLSNVGDFSRRFTARFPRREGEVVAGDLVMKNLYCAPPIRPHTNAAFLVSRYLGRMTVALRVDRSTVSRNDARDLLKLYKSTCLELAEEL